MNLKSKQKMIAPATKIEDRESGVELPLPQWTSNVIKERQLEGTCPISMFSEPEKCRLTDLLQEQSHKWDKPSVPTMQSAASTMEVLSALQQEHVKNDRHKNYTCQAGVIHPFSTFRLRWDLLTLIMLAYNAFSIPFRIAFGDHKNPLSNPLFWFDMLFDLGFILDVVLNFFTSYFNEEGHLVTEKRAIAKKYIKCWFWIDAVSSIPFELIVILSGGVSSDELRPTQLARGTKIVRVTKVLRILKLLKLFRVMRIFRLVERLERVFIVTFALTAILKFLCFVFYVTHWLACLFWSIGEDALFAGNENWIQTSGLEDQSIEAKYISSFYWSLMTITTIGYGDIAPVHPSERFVAIISMFIGAAIFTYGVTNIMNIFRGLDQDRISFYEKMDKVNRYMKLKQLPVSMQAQVRNYFHYTHSTHVEKESIKMEEVILTDLPASLRTEVMMFVNRRLVEKVPFFRDCDARFFQCVIEKLKPYSFPPNETILSPQDYGKRAFILSRGMIEVIDPNGNSALKTTSDGEFYGLVSLLQEDLTPSSKRKSIYTQTYCDMRFIAREEFEEIIDQFPETREMLAGRSNMRQSIQALKGSRAIVTDAHLHEKNRAVTTILSRGRRGSNTQNCSTEIPHSRTESHLERKREC